MTLNCYVFTLYTNYTDFLFVDMKFNLIEKRERKVLLTLVITKKKIIIFTSVFGKLRQKILWRVFLTSFSTSHKC